MKSGSANAQWPWSSFKPSQQAVEGKWAVLLIYVQLTSDMCTVGRYPKQKEKQRNETEPTSIWATVNV